MSARPSLPVGEAGFRALAAALPQMIWVSGPGGGPLYFSPKWVAFTGRDEAELIGTGFQEFVHPDDRGELARRRSDPERGQSPIVRPVEFRLQRHDGIYRLMQARVEYIRDEAGEILWVVGGALDITEERDAGAEVREQREQLRAALAATGMARYVYYPHEQRLVGDGRLSEILGFDLESIMADGGLAAVIAMVHEDDREMVERGLTVAFQGGPDYDVEYRFERPLEGGGSEERWIAASGRAEFDSAGRPLRMVGIIEDVTDRRHEEEHRLQSQKREAIGTLASGIAHDFNNVLSAILSNASLAEAEVEAGDSPKESLVEIARAARRAGDMVRRLLAASREEEPEAVPFDLGEVVTEACALVGPTLPRSVDFTRTVRGGLPAVVGDATQLHQVVMNLVTNASQAVGDHGVIRLDVAPCTVDAENAREHPQLPAGAYLAVRVDDNGSGIAPAVLGRVFDPYFSTKPAGQGTGLGLTASRRIVQNHGGEVEIRSEVGTGTTVTAYLPVAREGAFTPPAHSREPAPAPSREGVRVMFVDDELALVRLAEKALPMAGFQTSTFDRPVEAVAALAAEPSGFDVLVTDLSMPGLSGLELIAALRAIRPDLGVVLSSGYLTPEHRATAEELAVDAFVPKPCSIAELSEAIDRVAVIRA